MESAADVNKSMLDGDTPLYAACVSGKTAAVRMLLQHGDLDVNKARSDDVPLRRMEPM